MNYRIITNISNGKIVFKSINLEIIRGKKGTLITPSWDASISEFKSERTERYTVVSRVK